MGGGLLSNRTQIEKDQRERLANFRQEHQDLEQAIYALLTLSTVDQLQLSRLKKKKLLLKDQIRALETQLFPDIIA